MKYYYLAITLNLKSTQYFYSRLRHDGEDQLLRQQQQAQSHPDHVRLLEYPNSYYSFCLPAEV